MAWLVGPWAPPSPCVLMESPSLVYVWISSCKDNRLYSVKIHLGRLTELPLKDFVTGHISRNWFGFPHANLGAIIQL